jgi:U3 small nucleolar RNA-associated protein 10
MSASTILKRRAQALLFFVGYALKPSTTGPGSPSHDEHMSQLVTALISLATLPKGTSADAKVEDISIAARSSISRALGVMSVMDFIKAVLFMIESGDQKVSKLDW